jgi:HEAT repeat protein
MNTPIVRAIALCLVGFAAQAGAAGPTLPRDGWVSWEVEAVEGAPDFCCWSGWDNSAATRKACVLDDDRGSFGNRDKQTTDAVRVYARTVAGKIDRLRALSAICTVEARTPVANLGTLAADDSAHWLVAQSARGASMDHDLRENMLGALAMHRGDFAQESLADIARKDGEVEVRKKAIFWLALMRGAAGADIASDLMFNDPNPDVRQHASFAITQSKSPRVAQDLIRLGNTDKEGDVRAQAWFWLAQTGNPSAEGAIFKALRQDDDDHVREQAVFALSQLPDDRATSALIKVAEDRSLTHEQRKRAVFWLAQSDSVSAQTYLEKLLAPKGSE